MNEKWRLTELRVICIVAGEWGKMTQQLPGLILFVKLAINSQNIGFQWVIKGPKS